MNLEELRNFAIYSIEHGHQVDVLYTDFSKAFDRIRHDIIVRVLKAVGFHSKLLRWIRSYLVDRRQRVKVLNYNFGISGVSQGINYKISW